jgi:hypothetical protein
MPSGRLSSLCFSPYAHQVLPPHQTKYVKEPSEYRLTAGKPERLIGDKAYDSVIC